MSSLNKDNEYYICFDQLDLGFDLAAGDYRNRLVGLLLAARDLNLAAREANRKLFVAIFLRDDIYEQLHFEDKNKLTENSLSLIEWDTSRTDKTLQHLMEKRFKALLGAEVTWSALFDETKQMAGHQTKYQHILDRTYLRPRDIIRFSNSVLRQYKLRRKQEAGGCEKFENADINNARADYSGYLLNELDDEIHKHLPRSKDLLDVLRSLGVWQFDLEDFERHYKAVFSKIDAVPETPRQALQGLYEFSIVVFQKKPIAFVFKYIDGRVPFDMAATRFRIHPGLIEILGLKRFTVTSLDYEEAGLSPEPP